MPCKPVVEKTRYLGNPSDRSEQSPLQEHLPTLAHYYRMSTVSSYLGAVHNALCESLPLSPEQPELPDTGI